MESVLCSMQKRDIRTVSTSDKCIEEYFHRSYTDIYGLTHVFDRVYPYFWRDEFIHKK